MQKVKVDPFKVIGISVRTTNENGQAAKDIADMWTRFISECIVDKIPQKVDNTVYSLYTEYEGDHNKPYTAILGCRVANLNKIPEGMLGISIERSDYLKTIAKGSLMEGLVVSHWAKIFEMAIDRTYTTDFEVFGEKAQNPSNAEIEFYVAINP